MERKLNSKEIKMEPKQALLIDFDNDLPERIARGLEDWLFHKIQTEHDDIEWSSVVVKGIQIASN